VVVRRPLAVHRTFPLERPPVAAQNGGAERAVLSQASCDTGKCRGPDALPGAPPAAASVLPFHQRPTLHVLALRFQVPRQASAFQGALPLPVPSPSRPCGAQRGTAAGKGARLSPFSTSTQIRLTSPDPNVTSTPVPAVMEKVCVKKTGAAMDFAAEEKQTKVC
jgi:hypothetical protein